MAENKGLDFNCPQYFDFALGLDSSDRDDIFFDCEDPVRNDEVFKSLHSPGNTADINELTEDAENKLIDKMTAALSIIGNTPNLPIVKKKTLSENVSSRNACHHTAKNTMRKALYNPAVKIHRSKSVVFLNRGPEKQNKDEVFRKRSSSLSDLRTHKNKKNTYPLTPMCLKRTIKSKAKLAVKTTEEKELEEIARLQKQLIQHLRYNEMSLKKLNLKPRNYKCTKNVQIKSDNLKEMKTCEKGMNNFLEKLNTAQKETQQNIHKMNHEAVRNQAQKINSIINRGKCKADEKVAKSNVWTKTPSSSSIPSTSSSVSEAKEKSKAPLPKKPQTARKLGFHSGLTFHDNIKKNTVVKPFSFDPKIKETKNVGSEQNVNVSLSVSVLNLKSKDDKENIPHCRVQPIMNFKLNQNLQSKSDVSKYAGPGKVIRRITSQNRGLPLSENIRN